MVAPNFETTMPSASTEEQHTPHKLVDMTSSAKPKLGERAKRLVKSYLRLTNDDTGKNGDVMTLGKMGYDCDCDCPRVRAHPPLTLILPTTPNLAQHIACLPALARHAQSWLPLDDLDVGKQLNEVADMALKLQRKCAWLVNKRLPWVHQSANEMVRLLGEVAKQLKEHPLDKDGWKTAHPKAWPAQNVARLRARRLQTVAGQVETSIRELLEGEHLDESKGVIPELEEMAGEVARELEWLCTDYRWRGCRKCAGHVSSVLMDVLRSLSEIQNEISAGILVVKFPNVLDGPSPGIIPDTVREVRKAEKRAESLAQRIGETMSRFQRWSQVIEHVEGRWMELMEAKEDQKTRDGIREGL